MCVCVCASVCVCVCCASAVCVYLYALGVQASPHTKQLGQYYFFNMLSMHACMYLMTCNDGHIIIIPGIQQCAICI